MLWIAVSVDTTPEGAEALTGFLMERHVLGVEVVDPQEMANFLCDNPSVWDYKDETLLSQMTGQGAAVRFYLPDTDEGRASLAAITHAMAGLPQSVPELDWGTLDADVKSAQDDETWLNEWKKTYTTFRVGANMVVRPCWHEYHAVPGETVFAIDPGAVFGTGMHATTQMCMAALEGLPLEGKTVADIGCGSGILFCVALLLGAKTAQAWDVDPAALKNATENAQRNGIAPQRFQVTIGDVFAQPGALSAQYDVVLANVVADVIIRLAPFVQGMLNPGGRFIASGIIDERAAAVRAALMAAGLHITEEMSQEGWVCIMAK